MRTFTGLSLLAASITGALAGDYYDGYETVDSATDPVQIRLAYQGPSAMMVSWNTFEQLTSPSVSYGTDPNNLNSVATSAVSVTYPTSLTYNNHVNITGLAPFTTYYYLPQYSNATTPYSFTTARAAGDKTPFNVGVVVDMGTFGALGLSTTVGTGASNPLRPNEQTTIAALKEMQNNYEFLVHAGDVAYADYWLKEEIQNYLPNTTIAAGAQVYEHILNAFFDEMEPLTAAKAYMVNAGNHEANCDNGGTTNKQTGQKYTEAICAQGQTNFTGYINHWRMPSGPSGGLGNFWYSYDYGLVHFVHIDTETDLGNGLVGPDEGSPEYGGPFGAYNQQINWLTNDLASVNRSVTPWIVAFGHRGWYLSSTSSACANCQTAFEKLFYQYGVDFYMNGHAHLYERAKPTYQNVIDPNGLNNPSATLYLTNGAAGHYDGLDSFSGTLQPFSAYFTNADYSWTELSFLNSTHMTLTSMWSANNTVFDTATLYKAHNTTASGSTSSSSTSTTTMTSTSTTSTASGATPSYTNFNGQGHLYVYSGGLNEGDIGSAGTRYNSPGQNTATYTAIPMNNNGSMFILQHSTSYCAIASDSSFGCSATSQSGATTFGQTPDGNMTYNGSPLFYASSAASGSSRPTIYATPLPVTLNVVWGTGAPPLTGTPATTTATSTTTSSPSTNSTTTSSPTSTPSTISSTTTSTPSNTSSTASPTSTGSVSTITVSITQTVTQSASTVTLPASTTTNTQYVPVTQTTTSTETDSFTTTASYTETDSFTTTETDYATITQSTTTTETDSTTQTQTQTITTTETDSTTITLPASTETDSTTITLPASTITQTVTSTETDTTTLPASTVTETETIVLPASTSTVTNTITSVSTSTTTQTLPASTSTITSYSTQTITISPAPSTKTKTSVTTTVITDTVTRSNTVTDKFTTTSTVSKVVTKTSTVTKTTTK